MQLVIACSVSYTPAHMLLFGIAFCRVVYWCVALSIQMAAKFSLVQHLKTMLKCVHSVLFCYNPGMLPVYMVIYSFCAS